MKAALQVLLLWLVLLLPSAALPRKGSTGERISPINWLELSLPEELGLEAEERERENASLWERVRPSSVRRSRMTAATRLFSKPHPGAKCLQGMAEDGGIGWSGSSLHPWPLGGLEGPVCRVKMDQDGLTPRHLEVVGVLTHYESSFIKLLRQRTSRDESYLETFGLCPAGEADAALHPLKHIHAHVVEPGQDRFLVLHLEEVKWEAQAKLRFKLVFQAEVGRSLGELRFALLLFYLGSREALGTGRREELLATGMGLAREQSLCLARDTRYLVLGAAVASVTRSSEQLSFEASLAIRRGGEGGTPLSSTETQQLLFGSDDKCFTRMTPVLLLLAKSRQEEEVALAPFSYLSAEGVVDMAPYPQLSPPQAGTEELPSPTAPSQANASSLAPRGSSQFLSILTRFIRQVLSPSSEPPTQPSSRHWLDFQVMETLPHQLLNLSEEAALERLVQSEEPSVLLFPQDGGAVLEQHLGDWQPEGTVLQLLMGKLQTVIQELRDISAFQANMGLFQHLLSFCYYPLGPAEGQGGEQPAGSRKLHTLLLLKVLQTVRAHWQERRKVLRQNRSARHQAHCRLQELTIDLHDRKFIVMPTVYAANNCEGPCKLPLSTRVPSYYSHTVLLLGMQERGSPLQRAPCCVPVRYSDQLIISLSTEGLEVRKFPNMVAEECGCR
ncbi:PREDICTED: muellerian-inhibiting factor [Haliaeetus leucocephalus]|uniref:muellerian-inhibiting factor n=1 Tax=Haliaeetus leucocephalus TaxID=52644 RepID=UPI00053CAE11|nr:PREDICTED: muellerian-inhibiting factor [Haliaeetus leucocephalus]